MTRYDYAFIVIVDRLFRPERKKVVTKKDKSYVDKIDKAVMEEQTVGVAHAYFIYGSVKKTTVT